MQAASAQSGFPANTSAEPQFHKFGCAITRTGYSNAGTEEWHQRQNASASCLANLLPHKCHRPKVVDPAENAPIGTGCTTIPMKKHPATPEKRHNRVISHHWKDQELAGYTKSLQLRTISQ
ncbi:hypothetical protein [Komagataeibacter diospyri]|uniref:hypothetical protein n=1 Tax=Komagataeibacter diospyri TaxID=1932662 RepID=UPI0011429740|nr:hypothetical protein [Komagataeibacter diospyri]